MFAFGVILVRIFPCGKDAEYLSVFSPNDRIIETGYTLKNHNDQSFIVGM